MAPEERNVRAMSRRRRGVTVPLGQSRCARKADVP